MNIKKQKLCNFFSNQNTFGIEINWRKRLKIHILSIYILEYSKGSHTFFDFPGDPAEESDNNLNCKGKMLRSSSHFPSHPVALATNLLKITMPQIFLFPSLPSPPPPTPFPSSLPPPQLLPPRTSNIKYWSSQMSFHEIFIPHFLSTFLFRMKFKSFSMKHIFAPETWAF